MGRAWFTVAIIVAALAGMVSAGAAQSATAPDCSTPRGHYRACALVAAGLADFENARFAPGEREVRFWIYGGLGFPWRIFILRQTPDTTTARELYIWPTSLIHDSFAVRICGQTWSTVTGSACEARVDTTRDWSRLFRQLDAAGLTGMPSDPAVSRPCVRTPLSGCGVSSDGDSFELAFRSADVYWKYTFAMDPDPASPEAQRDAGVIHLLDCAAHGNTAGRCAR